MASTPVIIATTISGYAGAFSVIMGLTRLVVGFKEETDPNIARQEKLNGCALIGVGIALLYLGSNAFSIASGPMRPKPMGCRTVSEFKGVIENLGSENDMVRVINKIEKSPHGLNLLEWKDSFRRNLAIDGVRAHDMTHSVMVGCTPQNEPFFGLRHNCEDNTLSPRSYGYKDTSFYHKIDPSKDFEFAGHQHSFFEDRGMQYYDFCSSLSSNPDLFHIELDNLLKQNWTQRVSGYNYVPNTNFSLV